jgi:hypothetical protein
LRLWFQSGGDGLIGDNGIAARRSPKGENGLYRVGLAGRGIYGSATDAQFIAEDISMQLQGSGESGNDNGNVA